MDGLPSRTGEGSATAVTSPGSSSLTCFVEAETPPEDAPLASVEAVAHMGIAELEATLADALNPQVPVEVLSAVLHRLRQQPPH